MGGQGGQGSCWERGGTWLGFPSLLHSPNFHQTLGPRLPETKTQQAQEEQGAALPRGKTRGGTEPQEAGVTLRKSPGRTSVRTQYAWAGPAAREGGYPQGALRPEPLTIQLVWVFGGSTRLNLRKSERAEVLGTQHPCGEVGSWRNSEFHSPENMVWHLLSRF